jgi:hypothetical protein
MTNGEWRIKDEPGSGHPDALKFIAGVSHSICHLSFVI